MQSTELSVPLFGKGLSVADGAEKYQEILKKLANLEASNESLRKNLHTIEREKKIT